MSIDLLSLTQKRVSKGSIDLMDSLNVDSDSLADRLEKTAKLLVSKGPVKIHTVAYSNRFSTVVMTHESAPFPIGALFTEVWKIGGISTAKIEQSKVREGWEGQGFGYLMYQTAAKHYQYRASDNMLSQYSSAIWHKLWQEFPVRLLIGSSRHKFAVVPIEDWAKTGDIWKPLYRKDNGKLVSPWRDEQYTEGDVEVVLIVEPK